MGNDGSGVRRVAGLHPTEEGQEGGGVLWYAVVRPRRELELTNFPFLTRAILETTVRGLEWRITAPQLRTCLNHQLDLAQTFRPVEYKHHQRSLTTGYNLWQ